jgi:predicted ArsR family transcriptional regulator
MPRDRTDADLVDLLGDTRAQVVERLREGAQSVADLAAHLGLSTVAIRRHLQVLERDGMVVAETVHRDRRGRPGAEYRLTARARRLFPDRSAELASELLSYIEQEFGRRAMLGFLKWRTAKHQSRFALAADGENTASRAEGLAALLSQEGFAAEVEPITTPDGATTLKLVQGHCAIREVAEAHPELCAYEAAMFQTALGAPVSRRETIAGGADHCTCHITPTATDPTSQHPRSTHGHPG